MDATEGPWKVNYRMHSYVTEELPQLSNANFPVDPQKDVYFGPLYGRPWSSDLYFKESWKIQICVSTCSNLQSSVLSLG